MDHKISNRLTSLVSQRSSPLLSVEVFNENSQLDVQFLLIHGAMDRKSSMKRLALKLAPHKVIAYDRRGYDESLLLHPLEDIKELSPEEQVADIWRLIKGRPTVIFGHSMGGTLALHFATESPVDLVGLITYESPLPAENWWPLWMAEPKELDQPIEHDEAARRSEEFMVHMLGKNRWMRLPEEFRRRRRNEGVTLVAELAFLASTKYLINYGEITAPLFTLTGQHASERHLLAQRYLVEKVRNVRSAQIVGAHHGAHISNSWAIAQVCAAMAEISGYSSMIPHTSDVRSSCKGSTR